MPSAGEGVQLAGRTGRSRRMTTTTTTVVAVVVVLVAVALNAVADLVVPSGHANDSAPASACQGAAMMLAPA